MNWFINNAYASDAVHQSVGQDSQIAHSKENALHILNIIKLLEETFRENVVVYHFLKSIEHLAFNILIAVILGLVFYLATRKSSLIPGRLQTACEFIVGGLRDFVCGILGRRGVKYIPFLGTLFIYILSMNLIGLVPLMASPTAYVLTLDLGAIKIPVPTTTAALAILVFFYVQYVGIRTQGLAGYLHHLAGSPRDIFGYVLMPLMVVLHIMGEFVKPLSLAFRLYGNIWGEDVLLAVFIGLGVGLLAFLPIPAGVPLHFPFLLLAMVTGTIQAFVFTLLSTVYIAMMLPHEHGHEQTA